MRSMVSKKKKRYEEDGFDLDLTYITDRIIAMGFPSTGSEASYRNPVGEVQRFFAAKHKGKVSLDGSHGRRMRAEAQRGEAAWAESG